MQNKNTDNVRETMECPHCSCSLSSVEVDALHCPACGGQLSTHVDPAGELFCADDTTFSVSAFVELGMEIGALVERKQAAYGDSFGRSGAVIRILYPDGIRPDQYDDALGVIRVIDKLFRVATDRDALGESPWSDIAGYGLLGAMRAEQVSQ